MRKKKNAFNKLRACGIPSAIISWCVMKSMGRHTIFPYRHIYVRKRCMKKKPCILVVDMMRMHVIFSTRSTVYPYFPLATLVQTCAVWIIIKKTSFETLAFVKSTTTWCLDWIFFLSLSLSIRESERVLTKIERDLTDLVLVFLSRAIALLYSLL